MFIFRKIKWVVIIIACFSTQNTFANSYFFQNDYKVDSLWNNLNGKTDDNKPQRNSKRALALSYRKSAVSDASKMKYVNALDDINKALQIAYEIKDSDLISNSLSYKGYLFVELSDFSTGLGYLFDALKIRELRNKKESLANIYINISRVFQHQDNIDKAIYYCQLALKSAKESNNTLHIGASLFQFGVIYQDNKEWNKSLNNFRQALQIAQKLNDTSDFCITAVSIAYIYYSAYSKYDSATNLINRAIELAKITNDTNRLSFAYQYTGELALKRKDYKTATNYLIKGLNLFKEEKDKSGESVTLRLIAKCYNQLGTNDSAYKYDTLSNRMDDSILNEESIKKTTEMEALYSNAKNEKEIALLNKDKKIQELEIKKQSSLKYTFMGGLVTVCILFFFIYRTYKIRQSLKLHQLRIKIASDLHDDVGSTLYSIALFSELAQQESKEVAPMLKQIAVNSRKMLESMADIVWTIKPENDNFENIIDRMESFAYQLLRTKHIDFEFNTGDSIGQLKLSMEVRKNLYLIFKEALNNIIKYSEANRALLSISNNKNELTLLIRDNGKGFNINQETAGNGVRNMQKRASEMGAKLFIESELGIGTSIQLLINVAA